MVPYSLTQRAGVGAMPSNRTETGARVEILKQLRDFEHAVANSYGGIQARNIPLYDLVKSKHPEEWSTVTVPQAAKLVIPQRRDNIAALFAIHKYLMKHVEEFVPQIVSHRSIQTFDVRPQSHLDKLRAVKDMIHYANPAIEAFATKARRIMAENRKQSIESWDEPPTQEVVRDIVYTAEDRLIIEVLHHALRRCGNYTADPYALIITTILKKLEVPADMMDTVALREALVDLGHLAPWEDLVSRRKELNLDQRRDEDSPEVVAQNLIVERHLTRTTVASSTQPLGPEDFYHRDPIEHLRHDFGEMPVYVVDNPDAEELDDGLSVEEVPSEPGSAWIHVHIADPTSLLPPSHVFSQQAYQMGMTCYFTHRTWPMLPKSLVESKLSLGTSFKSREPEPVLTFSFKVDAVGNMVDYDVRAGLILNVKMIDYDSMDYLLGTESPFRPSRPFDLDYQLNYCTKTLESEHVQNLRLLSDTVLRHRQRNLKFSDAFIAVLPYARTFIPSKPLYSTPLYSLDPHYFRGFPRIKYEVLSQKIQEVGSRMTVAECMKAACRVASRWFLDRDVPMLRRTSKPPVPVGDPRALSEVLEARDPDGFVDFYLTQRANLHIPPVEHTLQPQMHWSMGVPDGEGYVRVTSPLRRYNDLVAHWQIKDALLRPGARPLFSKEWLIEYAPQIKAKERIFKEAERTHYDYWTALYLKRFIENPHATMARQDPLMSLTANVVATGFTEQRSNTVQTPCHIPSIGLKAMLALPSAAVLRAGECFDVRIAEISVGLRPKLLVVPR
ncbi:mitochondrial exoribonuclease [Scleroderma citrinum]